MLHFFENQLFYPTSDIQGEHFIHEYQLWNMNTSPLLSPNISPPSVVPLMSPNISPASVVPEFPESMSETSNKEFELRVYTRRNKAPVDKVPESITHCHESIPVPSSEDTTGNDSTIIFDTIAIFDHDTELSIAMRKDIRFCTKHPIQDYVSFGNLSSKYYAFVSKLDNSLIEPKNVHEALTLLKWRDAIQEEIRALEKNEIWELTDLPPAKCKVECKWIFTTKYNLDGSVNRYKARLMVKGFT